jgi:hypothetical protein
MKVNPAVTFWFGVALTIAQAVVSGTVHLTGLVPVGYLPIITGWASVFVTVGLAIQTAMAGASSVAVGPLAPPPTLAEADRVKADAIKAANKDK